jgi:tetratricopeptide (TPR) repeat protein
MDEEDRLPSREKRISAPVPGGPYVSILFVVLFLAGSFYFFGFPIIGSLVLCIVGPIVILLRFTDRVAFDGRRLYRTGLASQVFARMFKGRYRLRPADIEQIETSASRSLRRGGRYIYRYTTQIDGKGVSFTVISGKGYRQLMRALLPLLPDDALDIRSIEVRDFLAESAEALGTARAAGIPGADVLEAGIKSLGRGKLLPQGHVVTDAAAAEDLRRVANQLRLAGRLVQAVEAFRRALRLKPADAHLLFEFARCLHSLAGARGDKVLDRRAAALMRLSERRAGDDRELLIRLGESYFQFGDWRRAKRTFERITSELGGSFRALRGLAEVSMRSGKIAHVIHNFDSAREWVGSPSLKRWLEREVEYFSRLNSDDEYLEIEVSRMNLVETLERTAVSSTRIFPVGLIVILAGLIGLGTTASNLGWAVSAIALLVWVVASLFARFLSARIPPDMVGEE